MSAITIALAGNPNVGKSTIFNALTGARQHVGNWPGKTVERKEGRVGIGERDVVVVDLPGTYSLTAYSIEEVIARDFIVNGRPSAVVSVVDASNLERNLYLVVQLIETGTPLILALNMSDLAQSRHLKIDAPSLSARLGGVPVIQTVGHRNLGVDELKRAIDTFTANPPTPTTNLVAYGEALESEIDALQAHIQADASLRESYHPRWLAVKLLEEDEEIQGRLAESGHAALLAVARQAIDRITAATGEDPETLIADRRYTFISDVIGSSLTRPTTKVETLSDKIDGVVTHRIWGLPIFMLSMWLVFQFTANVSAPFLDWVDVLVNERLYNWILALMGALGLGGSWFEALLTDGVIAGVGGVLVFVPVLLCLYFALAILEDSGYMARAAFVMDRVMRWMGLHGKSFLPLIVGFGCTVPAVYATRTLENEEDRKLTAFLATFMSCGARLPVYVVFGAAFFGAASGNLTFAMYMLGIAVALITGLVVKRTVYRGKPPGPFVLELPPYRMPTPKGVLLQMWERTQGFLVKAGTVILAVSIALWFLMATPARANSGSFNDVRAQDSLFGTVSGAVAPVFRPAGFDNWQASGSLVTGFLAKEVVVATMNQIYVDEVPGAQTTTEEGAVGGEETTTIGQELGGIALSFGEATVLTVQEVVNIVPRTLNIVPGVQVPEASFLGNGEEEEDTTGLEAALTGTFTPLAAVAFNVFVLLYVPCMAAVSAMRQEYGTRWMLYQVLYTFALAWIAAVLVFQVGSLLGLG